MLSQVDQRALDFIVPCILFLSCSYLFILPTLFPSLAPGLKCSGDGFLRPEQVDIVLGKSESGLASAFTKNYKNGGRFVQCYLHPDLPENLDAIIKLAEWTLN